MLKLVWSSYVKKYQRSFRERKRGGGGCLAFNSLVLHLSVAPLKYWDVLLCDMDIWVWCKREVDFVFVLQKKENKEEEKKGSSRCMLKSYTR